MTHFGVLFLYDPKQDHGIVRAEDRKFYTFSLAQWEGLYPPQANERVVFLLNDEQEITRIQSERSYEEKREKSTKIRQQILRETSQEVPPTPSVKTLQPAHPSLWSLFLKCITTHKINFSQRASRREFAAFAIFSYPINLFVVWGFVSGLSFGFSGLDLIFSIAAVLLYLLFVPHLAVCVRRLHDLNLPPLLMGLMLTPPTAFALFLLLLLFKGSSASKRDEEPPKD